MKLGDVITLARGTTYKSSLLSETEGPILLGLGSIDREGGFKFGSWKHYPGKSDKRILLHPGDLYASLKDLTQACCLLGAVARVPNEINEGRLTQDTVKLEFGPDADKRIKLYTYWSLRTPQYRSYCKAHATGTTNMSLSRSDFLAWELPAFSAQNDCLVQLFESIEQKRRLNDRLNDYLAEHLKSCAKRLYREYERDEGAGLPEGWRWTTIGEISEMVCRGVTPKYNDKSDELILGQTCIRNNLVLLENGRLHAPRKITEKWLKKYDLLINSTGVGSLGRTAQVWFDPSKLVVDSHVTIVRAVDPRYALYIGFWAFEHERYIESLHTGSTGQTELPRDHVKAIRLVLPSDAELEKFNAVARPAIELIVANQRESKRLAELRDTLLPKLMSGEIDASNVAI